MLSDRDILVQNLADDRPDAPGAHRPATLSVTPMKFPIA
jgi:hypothetical protein